VPTVKKDRTTVAWIPAAIAAVMMAIGWAVPAIGTSVENWLYDRAVRLANATPDSAVAIVAIDDASISRLGAWPWPRGVHSQLLDKLQAAGVARVAFVTPFGEAQQSEGLDELRAALDLLKSNELAHTAQGEQLRKLLSGSMAQLDQDAELARAIAKLGNVWLPIEAGIGSQTSTASTNALSSLDPDRSYISADPLALEDASVAVDVRIPTPSLAVAAGKLAHVALVKERDGVIRTDAAVLRFGDRLLPSMAVSIAADMAGIAPSEVKLDIDGLLQLGRRSVPLTDSLQWRPTFYALNDGTGIAEYSYWQVLSGGIDRTALSGKTVFVGLANTSAAASIVTSLHQAEAPVHVVASAASSLYTQKYFRTPVWAGIVQILFALMVVAVLATALTRMNLIAGITAGVLLASAMALIEVGLLISAGTWLKLLLPAIALLVGTSAFAASRALARAGMSVGPAGDSVESLRMLGLTFQGQGQLELAYETFRRCPPDTQSLNLMYGLAQDYERRRQFNKAAEVYGHVASIDAKFKDVVERRDRMKRADIAQAAGSKSPAAGGAKPAARPTARADAPSVPVPKHATQPAKQTLGRYEIERELGKGAMGVVYLGRDPKINRVVAIKAIALAEEFAEDDLADARARFFREAEMAGRLNHPGIVTVYDAGEDRGLAYIAMEYLRGEHLSNYADTIHLLPVPRVLGLVARVADALDYAHKQNVVHRDIKPANIMFNKETDELKITDFGIARLTDTSRTKTGIVLGTPSFMSPEQLEGRPLDGRSDLFSLGITLYQLLTGQLPFRADSMTRLMHKIATEEHIPLRSLRPELPEFADQIMARALAKSTVDRYQSGAELAVALRTCIRLATRLEAVAR